MIDFVKFFMEYNFLPFVLPRRSEKICKKTAQCDIIYALQLNKLKVQVPNYGE